MIEKEQVIVWSGAAVLAVTFVWFVVAADNHERELINSGQCEATDRAMYHPPPTYQKVGETMVPINHDPYPRIYWQCEGGQKFWRRE